MCGALSGDKALYTPAEGGSCRTCSLPDHNPIARERTEQVSDGDVTRRDWMARGSVPRQFDRTPATSHGFVGAKSGADLVDMGTVGANALVKLIAGYAELFRPISDVGGHLGIDFFGVVRAFEVIFVASMRLVGRGDVVVLGHSVFPLFCSLRWMIKVREGMYLRRGTTRVGAPNRWANAGRKAAGGTNSSSTESVRCGVSPTGDIEVLQEYVRRLRSGAIARLNAARLWAVVAALKRPASAV
jgi:hypothetical protein